jgi:hypothetical protein
MSAATRPSRSVLIEHGDRFHLRVNPGDECWLTLPCQDADSLVVFAPGAKRTQLRPRRRTFAGADDSCATLTVGGTGRYDYTWTVAGRQLRGSFNVGRRARAM